MLAWPGLKHEFRGACLLCFQCKTRYTVAAAKEITLLRWDNFINETCTCTLHDSTTCYMGKLRMIIHRMFKTVLLTILNTKFSSYTVIVYHWLTII